MTCAARCRAARRASAFVNRAVHQSSSCDRIGSGIVALAGVGDGKVSILTIVSKDLLDRFHAGKLAGAAAEIVGGKGGGRPDMAQAGGSDPSKVDAALQKIIELVGA